jgi:putative PIG3 family NAD(P)H quinone oxidoreductase
MRAVVLRSHGGPEVLTFEDVADPVPGADEIVVDVAASALNRADLMQRMGRYPSPEPTDIEIPGLEFAGRVAATGSRVRLWKPGDAVMGILSGGGYATKVVLHERQAIPVPAGVDLVDAAAIPEVYLTAWDALVLQGGLTSGRWALISAGASGVGTAGIQIAKAIGARVAVTCSAGKADAVRVLGADHVFERSPHDWLSDARAAVPGGFDVILDVVGGDDTNRCIDALALRGRIVQVGTMAGAAPAVNLGGLMFKRAAIVGTVLRARPLEEKAALARRFAAELVPLFESGALRPVVDTRFPFAQVAEAQARMAADQNVGKILLVM